MEIILGNPPGIKFKLVPRDKSVMPIKHLLFTKVFGLAVFLVKLQRFFRHLCMSAKVPSAVRLVKQALREDKCVVIGLQSTGEARTEDAVSKYVRITIWILFHFI
jgi:hypothetical protein